MRQWTVWTEGNLIKTEHGVVGGAMLFSEKEAVSKNTGKKNATTAEAQAEAEAQSLWQHKLDRKYSLTPEEAQEPLELPMLAQPFKEKRHGQISIWHAQPKLDGVRCIIKWEGDKLVLRSRSGKLYDVPHIAEEAAKVLPKDTILDGELYLHGYDLQDVNKMVRGEYMPGDVEYWIYDMPVFAGQEDQTWAERYKNLTTWFSTIDASDGVPHIVLTPTYEIKIEDAEDFRDQAQANGYEGGILRDPAGVYIWGYRSNALVKVKSWQTAEFEVLGYKEGKGKMKGKVIFVCKNDLNDKTFDCVPRKPMAIREQYFKDGDKYIGRMYTVEFGMVRTQDDLPLYPRGIDFRLDEDLPTNA